MGIEKKEKMYSIGQFAEIGNVSVKQLRYLEHKKILQPNLRNPENNYRYYSERQLETLVYIKNLRDLGFELNQIVDIAKDGNIESLIGALRGNLAGAKHEIESVMQKYYNIAKHLIHINSCRAILKAHTLWNTQNDIKIISVPSKLLLFIRGNHNANVEQLFIERMAALKKYAADYDLMIEGAFIAIFHENYYGQFTDSYGDLETAFEVKGAAVESELKDKEIMRKHKAFRGVSAIHIGDYRYMRPMYQKLESWAGENGLSLSGTAIEEYILGPDIVSNPDEYVTRLILPIVE